MAPRGWTRCAPWWVAAGLVVGLWGASVQAQATYGVQADALFGARPGMALVTLQTDAAPHPWLSAEALVWAGVDDQVEGEALVMVLRARDPGGLGEGRLGRFVVAPGALRPVHIDGGYGRLNLPLGLSVEAFGGVPVLPQWDERAFDWTAGARFSRRIGDWGSVGVAYAQQRDRGALADEEVGLDVGIPMLGWLDLNGKVAWDLINPGISESQAALAMHNARWRLELFQWERSPSRIMPATSLFSVLGDQPSRRVGLNAEHRLAPRLDVGLTAAAHFLGAEVHEVAAARARLRLDPLGEHALGLELRREGAPEGGWSGARGSLDVALREALVLSGELELAMADRPAPGRGTLWPWSSLALRWAFEPDWEAAFALQASATPEVSARLDALLRVTRRWGGTL